ncbi:MAG TPA: hypothetical protein VFQ65_14520 [Kofleriaceae bacterium]|nr:hypothetical protein [Kofleriaceae bacterium]
MRIAVAIVLACVACGRLDFDALEVGTTCIEGAACDDGDPCTTGDRCTLGVCAPGPVIGCTGQPRKVTRSVGAASDALATATGILAITGSTATFDAELPDRIGIGDVVEYDADGDGTRDSLAFIAARLTSRVYEVRSAAGDTPTPTTVPTAGWGIFRAYLTLADAVDVTRAGTRNPHITAAGFDAFTGGRDLVAANEQRSIACYADAIDPDPLKICDTSYTRQCTTGWTTDAAHYLRIFTPVGATEVGASQRHAGTWGTGYRRTGGIIMYQGFIRLDGLSIQRSVDGNGRTYYVETEGHGGEIWISNSFGWNSITGVSKIYDIWDTGVPALGASYTVLKLWNDIAYNETVSDGRSGFYFNSNRAEAYAANCSAYVQGGGAFYESSLAHVTLTNCLGDSATSAAFASDDGFQLVTTSVSNDNSLAALGSGNAWNQPIAFANAGTADLHLGSAVSSSIHGAAVDLHADPNTPFSDDIDGQARPLGAWDIGADQAP